MNDYSKYSYARSLQFFEAYYPYDTEKVNYAELMLSMNKLSTIDELLSIRNRIISKYFKNYIVLCKLPKEICIPLAIGSNERFGQSGNSVRALNHTIDQDVYDCFNTNVFRLFKESKEPTLFSCGECIVNLTEFSEKYDKQINEVVQYSKEVYNIDAEELSKEIVSRKKSLHKNWREFKDFKEEMNGYQSAKQKVKNDLYVDLKYKWRPTIYDEKFNSEFLPQEMRIIPDNQEKKDNTPTWIYVVSGIVILAILIIIAPVIDVLLPWLLVFGFMFWLLGKY